MKHANSRMPSQWSCLDNAAKIFPSNSRKRDTKVFRFVCELHEPVNAQILQEALDQTMEVFPGYQSILKRGLFWYYLETCSIKPVVRMESRSPCGPLYDKNAKNLLFDVTYYRNRINVEVYHALSDGTGVLQFLRVLVYHYLTRAHADIFGENPPLMDYDASIEEKMDDSFQRYYSRAKKSGIGKRRRAYRLKGAKVPEHRIKVIEGVFPVKQMLALAHEYHTTLTVLVAAVFLRSIHGEMAVRAKKRPVVLTVPVNLRNFFDSESARNFFSTINVGYNFEKNSSELPDVIREVNRSFQEQLTPENMEGRLNLLASFEHNVLARVAPLVLKDVVLRIAHDVSAMENTGALSNIGKIDMPSEFDPYIRLFDVFVSTNKLQICMCSFRDNLTVSFTSPFVSSAIQKRFFRTFTDLGIPVEIATNSMDDE